MMFRLVPEENRACSHYRLARASGEIRAERSDGSGMQDAASFDMPAAHFSDLGMGWRHDGADSFIAYCRVLTYVDRRVFQASAQVHHRVEAIIEAGAGSRAFRSEGVMAHGDWQGRWPRR